MSATMHRDGELIALCDRLMDIAARIEEPTRPDDQLDVLFDERADIIGDIMEAAPPRTSAGAQALCRGALAIAERDDKGEITPRTKAEGIAWMVVKSVAPVTSDAAPSADAELIGLCDCLVAINAAEVALHGAIKDDKQREKAETPLNAEWHKIHARLLEIGGPKTEAGAAAAARAAPLNVNVNEDGSPMSGELGMWLCLAVCAYLTGDRAPFWRGTEAEGAS